jgi:hypothetical protein
MGKNAMKEIWKKCIGNPDYEISNTGDVSEQVIKRIRFRKTWTHVDWDMAS